MAVLFDLDGTLLDTVMDFVAATNMALRKRNLAQVSVHEVKPGISWGLKRIVELVFQLDPNDPEFDIIVAEVLANYAAHNFVDTKPFPGILQLLNRLEQANIVWGIVTNKREYLTLPLLKSQKLDQRAKCIVCGDTTPFPKPAPDPLLHASRLINIAAKDCIYIGDAKHDIIAGNAAGMYTIAALYGYIPQAEVTSWPAQAFVNKVADIFPIVYQWHQAQSLIT